MLPLQLQVRTKQEEVDHKEEVLAVLLERYAGMGGGDPQPGRSHANLGALGVTRQGSLTALSKASLATTDSKASPGRPTAGDVKRLGSSRGRLDIKVAPSYLTPDTASRVTHTHCAGLPLHSMNMHACLLYTVKSSLVELVSTCEAWLECAQPAPFTDGSAAVIVSAGIRGCLTTA